MTIHRYQPTHYYRTIGPHDPVLHIADGDTVITSTIDAWGQDEHCVEVSARGNPQTGPFYVDGAEPGDTLVLHLDRLYPNRDIGYTRTMLAPNVLDPSAIHGLPADATARWQIDRPAGTATLIEPATRLGAFKLPLAPMLGCFGVCPPDGQAISTATAGQYGGNMDYRGFVSGVTVYLPVYAPGALLFVGDGHAVQGDGEIIGTGIEISFEVQFTVRLLKGKLIQWPRGETATHLFTVGNARPLDQAAQHATTEMFHWLQEDYGLDPTGASLLLGQCVEYELGNLYDPAYTMVCKIARRFLAQIAPQNT
jgi:acetamidase/formamidase